MSFAFGGAMYAWPYLFGVARCIQERDLLTDGSRIYAASAGVLPAVLMLCGVEVGSLGTAAVAAGTHDQLLDFGHPYLHPRAIRRSLDWVLSVLPADAHRRVSGRLFVTITQVPSLRRLVVAHFADPSTLIDVMLATMSLPLHGVWLAYRSRRLGWCLDGALIGPGEDERPGWGTIRVSTLARKDGLLARVRQADISPSPPLSLREFLLPGTLREQLALVKRGYRDAATFFGRSDQSARPLGLGEPPSRG